MRFLLALCTLTLLACSAPQGSPAQIDARTSTLHVINQSGNHLTFYVDGLRVGTVTRSQECLLLRWDYLPGSAEQTIQVRATGEPSFPLAPVNLRAGSWKVEISPWPGTRQFDALTISPSPRCDSRRT